jgi:formate hydrogenlyase subunit 4
MELMPIINIILMLLLAPLMFGAINRVKAFFGGRQGQPLLQLYHDLFKLLRKGAVYSRTTTWVFRLGPVVGLAALLVACSLVPLGGGRALFAFDGDLVLFLYLLGLARFAMVLAALDTGSSFEGMGASREVHFAVLAEPTLFLGLAVLMRLTGQTSLSGIYSRFSAEVWVQAAPVLLLVAGAVLMVFLCENARIPVDDPNTHLELTMIHEVMALDHGGVDLAFIQYGAALKFWLLGALLVGFVLPLRTGIGWLDAGYFVAAEMMLAFVVGVIESIMARLRLLKVPHMLVVGLSLSVLALIFQMR